jgi:hypothetical protein
MNSTVFLTAALVLITAYYALQTRKTVKAMEEANELQNRPVICISIWDRKESISFLDFVVTNSGKGLARNISFSVVGENILLKEIGGKKEKLSDFRVIKNGIKNIAPGETRRYWFMSVIGRIDEIQKADVKVKVTYYGIDGKHKYDDIFDLDFLSLPEYQLGDDPLYKMSSELEKIRRELERSRK